MKIRAKKPRAKKPKLTEATVTRWMRQFKKEEGYYPSSREPKGVPDQPNESWGLLNGSLLRGGRGLPGGSSLAIIRNKLVGLPAMGVRVIPTETREVEEARTVPLVPESQRVLIAQLPVMERGILTRYLEGEKQQDIGELYGITQAAVSYKIKRSLQRLEFLEHLTSVSTEDFKAGLQRLQVEPETQRILLAMRKYACQSRVADRLKLTQGKVRYRILKAAQGLQPKNIADLEVVRQVELLRDNPGLLHEQIHSKGQN